MSLQRQKRELEETIAETNAPLSKLFCSRFDLPVEIENM